MASEGAGYQALVVVAFDCWSTETLGRSQGSLAENVTAWLAAGRPGHGMLTGVLRRLRAHVEALGRLPEWVPPELAEALAREAP